MTPSRTQGEHIFFPLDEESTTVKDYRTKPLRRYLSFLGGLFLGLLPLCLYILNHLLIPSSFGTALVFCNAQTYTNVAWIEPLDTFLPVIYYIETGFSVLFVLGAGVAMLIQRIRRDVPHQRNAALFWASGLLLAVVLTFLIFFALLFPFSWHQCFLLRD